MELPIADCYIAVSTRSRLSSTVRIYKSHPKLLAQGATVGLD
jgi:hypothetical protein